MQAVGRPVIALCCWLMAGTGLAAPRIDYVKDDEQLIDNVHKGCTILLVDATNQLEAELVELVETRLFDAINHQGIPVFYASHEFFRRSRDSADADTSKPSVRFANTNAASGLAVAPRVRKEKCLLHPMGKRIHVNLRRYAGDPSTASVLEFINEQCNTYLTEVPGRLTMGGLNRQYILDNRYRVADDASLNAIRFDQWSKATQAHVRTSNGADTTEDNQGSCGLKPSASPAAIDDDQGMCTVPDQPPASDDTVSTSTTSSDPSVEFPRCHEIDASQMPSQLQFYRQYLAKSRPLIIRNAVSHWPARQKWTNDFFRQQNTSHENNRIHVKLTPPVGDFEGVEPMSWWNHSNFQVPSAVLSQIEHPDLVLVRPDGVEMTIGQFIDLVEHKTPNSSHFSAYMEYTSMAEFVAGLKDDAPPLQFIDDLLTQTYQNVWLSDGNTLGKLHFDAYDNILAMVSGTKQVLMIEPWNNRAVYEGRIIEGTLSYVDGTFERRKLNQDFAESFAPVDVKHWNREKFPLFGGVHPLNCTINSGDILYMPAYWWHEVQSRPDPTEHRNLAVNFWYAPFLDKEIPCAECPFDVNPLYRHLLETLTL